MRFSQPLMPIFVQYSLQIRYTNLKHYIIKLNQMNHFDPFYSTEYYKADSRQMSIESEPELSKKSQSEFLSHLLGPLEPMSGKDIQETGKETIHLEKDSSNAIREENSQKSSSSSSKDKNSKNSPFHNFQKHLVITLRQIITLKQLAEKNNKQYDLVMKLFTIFQKSKKTSRIFLEQIYGIYEKSILLEHEKIQEFLRKSQINSLFEQFTLSEILQAQSTLRKSTLLELQSVDINQCLDHRKIQKKNQFISYMQLFKEELVNGKHRKKTYKKLSNKFQTMKRQKGQQLASQLQSSEQVSVFQQ